MLYGATVRNPGIRGHIRSIHFEDDVPWDDFTVVTAQDIPGENCVTLLLHDHRLLAAACVQHAAEPVPLSAPSSPYLVEAARRAVPIEIDPLPSVFSMDKAPS